MATVPGKGRGRGRGKPPLRDVPVPTVSRGVPGPRTTRDMPAPGLTRNVSVPAETLGYCPDTPPSSPGSQHFDTIRRSASSSPPQKLGVYKGHISASASNGSGTNSHLPTESLIGVVTSLRKGAFPKRPGYGKEGRPITLVANHFEMSLPCCPIYHYDVEIGSTRSSGAIQSVISKNCKRQVFKLLVDQHKRHLNGNLPVFDGQKNMYTRKPLGFQKQTFKVTLVEPGCNPDVFVVTVQLVATLDMGHLKAVYDGHSSEVPQAVIQALDVILRYGPSAVYATVGRSLFTPPKNAYDSLGGGLELWHGYQTSVRPAQWKPLLNINTVATAFYEAGPLLELVSKLLGYRGRDLDLNQVKKLDDKMVVKLNKKLKRLKIKVTHLLYPRKYTIERVTRASANELTFGTPPTSVAGYFASKYHPLKFPHLPCIEVGTKRNYIPLEVCVVMEGQHCKQKLDENQTSAVIKKTALPPEKRFQKIGEAVQDCIGNNREFLDHFGIRINPNPVQVPARVLPAPQVMYQNDIPVSPFNGAWELQGMKFYHPADMTKWTVLSFCDQKYCPKQAINKFVSMLVQHGRMLGMTVEQPLDIKQCSPRSSAFDVLSKEKAAFPGLQIVFVIVTKNSPFYNPLKNAGETEVGVLTQCVRDQSITNKCNPALIVNIIQKVNAKLGGINNTIPDSVKTIVFRTPTIVMGADVTHPAAKEFCKPSIAAVVASMDRFAFRYVTTFRIQKQDMAAKARIEIIEDMKNIAKELLLTFFRINNQAKPRKILFYRDGVSDGQFRQVLDHELVAIRAACTELEAGYEPGITFLTVQKRHHTRFKPQNRNDGGKTGNVPPGTTVDSVVTHPVHFDFFLCSHFGLQGTSRPAHYYVLWDDNDFSADNLQKLTYGLCHTYARCARSVSIPVPVYYAHHATKRAKCYVDARSDIYDSSSSSGGFMPSTAFLDEAVTVLDFMKNSMFFV